jgi:predicted small lipoprotein YifL
LAPCYGRHRERGQVTTLEIMWTRARNVRKSSSILLLLLALAGCTEATPALPPSEAGANEPQDARRRQETGTLFGSDGFTLYGSRSREAKARQEESGGVGVNSYLWRASLDTIDFMPVANADPFGGLITTDWYQPAEAPNERFKLQVLVRDKALRADGIKVSVWRQTRSETGDWLDAPVDPKTAAQLEDRILTRARELRIAAASSE